MNSTDDGKMLFSYQESKRNRVNGGWAGMAIAHPGFGRIEGAAILLLTIFTHPALGSY